MGTKELGWSSSKMSRARFLALALSVSSLAVVARAGTAYAVDQRKARDKIVELNKQALLSYQAKDFETARNLLKKAIEEAQKSGLDDDKMTARTYLHLGAVDYVGFHDQASAIKNFTLSKKIRPDIQLTPSIETPELKSVFDQAVVEPEATPEPAGPSKPQPTPTPEPTPSLGGSSEPDLPSSMPSPLMCSTPEESPPGKSLMIRCALKPGINAKSVLLHHRAPGAEAYQSLPMHRTAKGWYVATLPGQVMKGTSIQVYYDARDGNDGQLASNGQEDSPSVIEIHKRGGGGGGGSDREGDPLQRIKDEQAREKYEGGLHRRRQGAFWLAFAGGMGWGYAPKGPLEWAKSSKGGPHIMVSAVSTTTGLFSLLPEVGYMLSDNFSLSAQFRMEFIRQDQVYSSGRTGAPSTGAPAGFLRALWFFDLSSDGNLQLSAGASAGGGYVRFPVKPQILRMMPNPTDPTQPDVPDPAYTIEKTDTRPMGIVLLGPSAGVTYHLSRYFGLAFEARALTGFPNFGFAVEGNLSVFLALGGKSGPKPEGEEEEGEGPGETGAVNDAPAPDDSPSSSDEGE